MIKRNLGLPFVPFVPRPDQLLRALDDVHIQIQQLITLFSRLHATSGYDTVTRSALLCCLVDPLHSLVRFLEDETRSVHYSSGIRQENDDVLAFDFGFSPEPLPIPQDLRRELYRDHSRLSYSSPSGDHHHRRRFALVSLALPVLRRCATFAHHLLESPTLLDSPDRRALWLQLSEDLEVFSVPSPQPALSSDSI